MPTFKKGEKLTAEVASLAAGGEGVTRQFGPPVFISRVAPKDVAEVELFDVRKDFARGQVVDLLEPSPQRGLPPCKVFKVCGGCQWQHLQYQYQLEAKTDLLRQALKFGGGLSPDLVRPAIGAQEPLYYRNKVQFPVQQVKSTGRILAGYYKEGSHELVNIKHCPVQPEPMDRMLEAVKELLEKFHLSAYDEETHKGLVRHIAARFSFAFDKLLVTLVLNCEPEVLEKHQQKYEALASELMQAVPEVVGVCLNFNSAKGNTIMGRQTVCVGGDSHIIERLTSGLVDAPGPLLNGLEFRLSPTSFFQVNTMQAAVLLDQMLQAVRDGLRSGPGAPDSKPLIVDAYAGVGTMALWLSSIAEKIVAIEEVASSVQDGKVNLELNGIKNVEFVRAKVEDHIPTMLRDGMKVDVLVVDPPRKGVERSGLDSIIALAPGAIVYVSCNPSTLARDLKILSAAGYRVERVQPIDMFPQTYHVESVTLLTRAGQRITES
jgi:23S rRNA (uracil1939-C5)-methyltransferase